MVILLPMEVGLKPRGTHIPKGTHHVHHPTVYMPQQCLERIRNVHTESPMTYLLTSKTKFHGQGALGKTTPITVPL